MKRDPTDQPTTSKSQPMRLSEFAARVGRSKPTITEASRKSLAGAMTPEGRLDVASPIVAAWLKQREISPEVLKGPAPSQRGTARVKAEAQFAAIAKPSPASTRKPADAKAWLGSPPDLDELAHITVREVAEQFGSLTGMIDFVEACKKLEETRKLRLANGEHANQLIERSFVQNHVFGLIDGAWRRVVVDAPKTIALRVGAAVRAGQTNEETEKMVRQVLSDQLRQVQTTAMRRLKTSEVADQSQEHSE